MSNEQVIFTELTNHEVKALNKKIAGRLFRVYFLTPIVVVALVLVGSEILTRKLAKNEV